MPQRVVAPLTQGGQNKRTIEEALLADLAAMQAILDTPNATLTSSPAAAIKAVARTHRRLIRHTLRSFDAST